MRLHHSATALLSTLVLAACVSTGGLHPDGKPLDPAALQAGRSLAGLSLADWPQADWWTGLADPQLDALIAEALANNPDLAVADARARQAQALADSANADRGPQLNSGASIAGTHMPTTVLPSQAGGGHFTWAKYAYASFSWGLDLWGGQRAAWEAALGRARAAEVETRAARIEVSTNVARAYVQLGYAFAQHDVAQAELDRAGQARELTRQRVAAGLDNQLQLKQADSEVAAAEQQLALAARTIDAARNALAVLLGKGPDRGLDLTRPRALQPTALAVPADLTLGLLGHRPDLVAARWRVEAATRDIVSAKAEFMPNLSLSALAGVVGMGGTNLLQLPARFYNAGPALSLPIFDSGRRRANLAGMDAQYDLAVAQYNQTLVGALNQVADDVDALQSIDQQIAAQQRALDAANQAWQLAEQRYRAGVGSYLEALLVRQQLLVAEQRMAALKAQQVDQSVLLVQSLGGGYRPQPEMPAPPEVSVSSISHP
jgi:NodT family efflux transporter outer membrane factor (OMF) lipoprotein